MSDNQAYQALFDDLASTRQVEFLNPCGKLELYMRLAEANVLSYPATFAETFCLSALEARVMENALFLTPTGALPEVFSDANFAAWTASKEAVEEWAAFMVRRVAQRRRAGRKRRARSASRWLSPPFRAGRSRCPHAPRAV